MKEKLRKQIAWSRIKYIVHHSNVECTFKLQYLKCKCLLKCKRRFVEMQTDLKQDVKRSILFIFGILVESTMHANGITARTRTRISLHKGSM